MPTESRSIGATVSAPKLNPVTLPALTAVGVDELTAYARLEQIQLEDASVEGQDLSGIDITEARFDGLRLWDTPLREARFAETVISRLDAPVLSAVRLELRDVELLDSRIASAELHNSSWQSVRITGCKLGYLNLRSSDIRDLLITDSTIDELDIAGATLQRVAFDSTTANILFLRDATLSDIDLRGLELGRVEGVESLRGATMTDGQVHDLAPVLAGHIGIRTEPR